MSFDPKPSPGAIQNDSAQPIPTGNIAFPKGPESFNQVAVDPKVRTKKQNKSSEPTPHHPKDMIREIKETIVFVVVLVLLLKLFVAEAFVIPTGSMAETLWGDKVVATCRECQYEFPINASERNGARDNIRYYICPNCGFRCVDKVDLMNDIGEVWSGDRVLVSKYEFHLRDPKRFDVPVFKYPVEPYSSTDLSAMNYIKRLVGLPGETIAVYKGDLYVTKDLKYENRPRPTDEADAWHYKYMYPSDHDAMKYFDEGKFEPVRKSPDEILAVRRIVFDLDHQAKRLSGVLRQRWHPSPNDGNGWNMEEKGFIHSGNEEGWMRYQHQEQGWESTPNANPALINDYLGYNTGSPGNWVPDLIVETKAEFQNADAELTLELSKGWDRFQARFAKGQCKLVRIASDGKEEELASQPTKITSAGTYSLRLANVDSRLTVWVDGKALRFGKEADYASPNRSEFNPSDNDRDRPVRIGAKGSVRCSQVQIWRDLYYTCSPRAYDIKRNNLAPDPSEIPDCNNLQTFYVQPGHFLCFGDNSASSSDSRSWGLVPARLMLGRAILVYSPWYRMGVIR